MTPRRLVSFLMVLVAIGAAPSVWARPKQLKSAPEVLSALKAGNPVHAVFRDKDMKLVDDEGKETAAPDATGGMGT